MGLFDDISEFVGDVVGTVAGVVVGTLAASASLIIGCTGAAAQAAVDAGCKTVEEIRAFVDDL